MNTIRNFASLSDWINQADQDSAEPCASTSPRKNFTGVDSKAEAFRLFRAGHPEGLERMKQVLGDLRSRMVLETTHDVFENDVQGCAPDIVACIQGMPEDMFVISQIESTAPPSNLTVQFELAYAARITIEQAALGGAVVFAAMEALRVQGCNVSILMSHTSETHNGLWQATAPVPNTLDLDTLAFLFTHPAMLRVIVFSLMEAEPPDVRDRQHFWNNGYGMPAVNKNENADAMITMANIVNKLQYSWGQPGTEMERAHALLIALIETRFGTFDPSAVNNA